MYKLALITGASSGLGKALCKALAKQGIPLILTARDLKALKTLAQELSVPTHLHQCDLSSEKERKNLIELIHEKTPDLVINNAGFGLYGPILSHHLERFQNMLQVNAQAAMELSIESARALQHKHLTGTILNVSSAAAFFPYPTFCIYAASKAFLNHFSEGFDEEMAPKGIRILTVCPGQIDTEFRDKAACGVAQEPDSYTLSQEKAVRLILKQIKQGNQRQIIDGRYRWGVFLGKLLPKFLRNCILIGSLKNRYHSTEIV